MYIFTSGRAAAVAFVEHYELGRASTASGGMEPPGELPLHSADVTKVVHRSRPCSRCQGVTLSSPGLNDAGPSPSTRAASARSEPTGCPQPPSRQARSCGSSRFPTQTPARGQSPEHPKPGFSCIASLHGRALLSIPTP